MSDTTIVAAKQEYTQQLCNILNPLLYEGFKTIWKNCNLHSTSQLLKSFQKKLTSIPIWNQDVIDNEYNRIIKETDCLWLDKLIEAVFLSNVKVLSTIRIGKIKTINITIPDTKKFIHHCYIEAARRLWLDPHLIDDRIDYLSYSEIKRNEKRMIITLSEAIEKTISKLIPIQNILESYLKDIDQEENYSDNNTSLKDNNDPDNGNLDFNDHLNNDENIINKKDSYNFYNNDDDGHNNDSDNSNDYKNNKYDGDKNNNNEKTEPIYNSHLFTSENIINNNDDYNGPDELDENNSDSTYKPKLNVTEGQDINDVYENEKNKHFENHDEDYSKNITIKSRKVISENNKKEDENNNVASFFSDSDSDSDNE